MLCNLKNRSVFVNMNKKVIIFTYIFIGTLITFLIINGLVNYLRQ